MQSIHRDCFSIVRYYMSRPNIPEFEFMSEEQSSFPVAIDLLEKNSNYNPTTPHRHNGYEIFLFEEGGGLHMIDFKELEIRKGEVHILCPGQVHYMHRAPSSKGLVLKLSPDYTITGPFAKKSMSFFNKLSAPCIEFSDKGFEQVVKLVHNIEDELKEKTSGFYDMVQGYVNLFIMQCERFQAADETFGTQLENEQFIQFRSLLEAHFSEEHSVRFYCEQMAVSQDRLTNLSKRSSGKTASEFIANRILLEAKRWLLHSNKSVKEIAYQLNFQDHAYFNRWFKKITGTTPGELRTTLRDKYNG